MKRLQSLRIICDKQKRSESAGERYIKAILIIIHAREPVWPSGKALGWQAEWPRFESASAVHSLQKLWSVDTVL